MLYLKQQKRKKKEVTSDGMFHFFFFFFCVYFFFPHRLHYWDRCNTASSSLFIRPQLTCRCPIAVLFKLLLLLLFADPFYFLIVFFCFFGVGLLSREFWLLLLIFVVLFSVTFPFCFLAMRRFNVKHRISSAHSIRDRSRSPKPR